MLACTGCRLHFCGSCLFNRFGWNIDQLRPDREPGWLCPVCMGVCDCSGLGCVRARRGLGGTGQLVEEAKESGFKSAMHYQVLTSIEDMGADELAVHQGLNMCVAGDGHGGAEPRCPPLCVAPLQTSDS